MAIHCGLSGTFSNTPCDSALLLTGFGPQNFSRSLVLLIFFILAIGLQIDIYRKGQFSSRCIWKRQRFTKLVAHFSLIPWTNHPIPLSWFIYYKNSARIVCKEEISHPVQLRHAHLAVPIDGVGRRGLEEEGNQLFFNVCKMCARISLIWRRLLDS